MSHKPGKVKYWEEFVRLPDFPGVVKKVDENGANLSFSTAQLNRIYLQPERIDQIMPEERLNEICASINVQIRPFLLLNFGDFFRNISV